MKARKKPIWLRREPRLSWRPGPRGAGGFFLGGPLGAANVGLEAGAVWDTAVFVVFGRFIEENGHKPSTCAEPQAVHKAMADNPNIKPSEVRMNTVEVRKGGKIYPKPR